MEYLFEAVKENVYVLAIWDSSWNSYNNCYFIVQEDGITLIDSSKEAHSEYLVQSLKQLGKSPEDVKFVLATHGHEDHVQGASILKNAKKYIHHQERSLIEYPEPDQFHFDLSNRGVVDNFEYLWVGHHTPGSLAFYHRPSKVLFTGDFLCFFGDPLSKDGLVSVGNDLRHEWLEFLRNGGVAKDDLNDFLNGLKAMNGFNVDVMCTGHGGVLVGDIESFVSELLNVGTKLQEIQVEN
ncbi:glyoxylase-like metal-dependent hydrolase (beta-lactamase superfamily II) [Bacillus niacini]|uniref:Glyoxylase-like metal-dependent hydrolase (Beta-lactamase superfamily II) n=1 Tax=Neobacillus niacini TaxID=86668 RepID=A0A852TK28_9BACI|nr:MBL fold metallo-hydrolase [Neobacillus niacini]NYE09102.1 glyoxylase-like metal-dependent hydrolase (beta-lactamase superfamily II) [Neobacillus niacini]